MISVVFVAPDQNGDLSAPPASLGTLRIFTGEVGHHKGGVFFGKIAEDFTAPSFEVRSWHENVV